MKRTLSLLAVGMMVLATVIPALAQSNSVPGAMDLPGERIDGSILLPNQWSLRPVGKQVPLGDFPVNIAVHPDGHYAAVLHSGYGPHEIVVVDLDKSNVV